MADRGDAAHLTRASIPGNIVRRAGQAGEPGAEIGASYRAGNPEGLATWQILEHLAHPTGWQTGQPWGANRNWKTFREMTLPILLQAGDADMGPSPALQRLFSSKFPNRELRVIEEAGHAPYWEQPDAFNASVLEFISRHGRKTA